MRSHLCSQEWIGTHLVGKLWQTLPNPDFDHPRKLLHRAALSGTPAMRMLRIHTSHSDMAPARSLVRDDDRSPPECEKAVERGKVGRKGVVPPGAGSSARYQVDLLSVTYHWNPLRSKYPLQKPSAPPHSSGIEPRLT